MSFFLLVCKGESGTFQIMESYSVLVGWEVLVQVYLLL